MRSFDAAFSETFHQSRHVRFRTMLIELHYGWPLFRNLRSDQMAQLPEVAKNSQRSECTGITVSDFLENF